MVKTFSEKYKDLLLKKEFLSEFSRELKIELIEALLEFNEVSQVCVSRYDSYKTNINVENEVLIIFGKKQGNSSSEWISIVDKEWYFKREDCELMDIIELWHSVLSDGEKVPFQVKINLLMSTHDKPWRLLEGRFIKIDSQQFDKDLADKFLFEFSEILSVAPEFESAYSEFVEAKENITVGQFEYAVINACKSYESTLKVILSRDEGNAGCLTKEFVESFLMEKLPSNVKNTAFNEKILMSLPFLRNQIAGHGDGREKFIVSNTIGKLAVNLAATLNSYLLDTYRKSLEVKKQKEENPFTKDDLPF